MGRRHVSSTESPCSLAMFEEVWLLGSIATDCISSTDTAVYSCIYLYFIERKKELKKERKKETTPFKLKKQSMN